MHGVFFTKFYKNFLIPRTLLVSSVHVTKGVTSVVVLFMHLHILLLYRKLGCAQISTDGLITNYYDSLCKARG